MKRARARPAKDVAGLHLLAAFIERSRRLERNLALELQSARAEEAARLATLRARRLELRQLELLGERLARAVQVEAAKHEWRALDDLVMSRRPRR